MLTNSFSFFDKTSMISFVNNAGPSSPTSPKAETVPNACEEDANFCYLIKKLEKTLKIRIK
jgi:hypothetical protein